MVSLNVNCFLKYIFHCGYDLSNFQGWIFEQLQDDSSSCKSLVSNLGLECVSFIESWNYEVDCSNNYLSPKESYMSHSFENNKLLNPLVNILMLIFFFIAPEILLTVSEWMDYFTNQFFVLSFYPDWFHVFTILALHFSSCDDYDGSVVCN